MTDSKSDQRRFHNLTQEQVETLDQVLTEVIPIHGRGNFPTLEVKPKDIIHVVRDKLVAKEIKVRDVRLNGSTASHVLVKENGTSYKDLDIIFGVELPKQEDFQIIKEVVLSCLLDFLPQGVNKDKITALTMKEAYVQKMVKVFTEHDRWSLISLSNNSGKNVELKFVNSLRRQFEFSVDSFQIILDRMLESYLEAERRQAAEAQRAADAAAAAAVAAAAAAASAAAATSTTNTSLPSTASQSEAPVTETTLTEAPSPASTDSNTILQPQQEIDTTTTDTHREPEAAENRMSNGTSLSEAEIVQQEGASSPTPQAHTELPKAACKEEVVVEVEVEVKGEVDAQPQQQQQQQAETGDLPGEHLRSTQTEAVPMEEAQAEPSDNKQSPDRLEIATAERDTDKPSRAAAPEESKVRQKDSEAVLFVTQLNGEHSNHTERVPKSLAIMCEPMEVNEEEAKAKANGDAHVPTLPPPLSSLPQPSAPPSLCPFLMTTQVDSDIATAADSYHEYPVPPPAKKNTRSSQMVVLKHSSPKPPRKMSKKVTSVAQASRACEKPTARSPPLQSSPAAPPSKLLCPPKIDPTECVPMQVELAGVLSNCSKSPCCAPPPVIEPSSLPPLLSDLSTPTPSAATPKETPSSTQETHSPQDREQDTHPPYQTCESSSSTCTHTQTLYHLHTQVQTHTHVTVVPEGQPGLHRDQNTQTEPLPLEAQPPDAPKPIIQVNSQPLVHVDEPSPALSPDPLLAQVQQPGPVEEPKLHFDALESPSQQPNNVPIVTYATGDLTPGVSEPHLSGQKEVSDSLLHTETQQPAETSNISDVSCAQPHMDEAQANVPQCPCEVAEAPVPSVSPLVVMPPALAEMPMETVEFNATWSPSSEPVAMVMGTPPVVTSSHPISPPPPPPPNALPTREVPNVTVVAESMYGDFEQAMDHLRYRLIATRNPEEIRGGGLLKYSNLLVREFKPASETEIKTLERYMCSRFFIDFPDVNEQQRKIESYLRNHFIGEEKSKYDYLMTLRRVVDESTVCLMGHERRQTLNMITILALKVLGEQNIIPNTNNVTCFYQPAPYMTDHNFSNYYIANGQSPVIYHPYPLHIHMQTGLV
ncbi:hypothetical protein ACEWY4_027262 [Coilia grayii]|uniref:polynucleotide adenylyltransferase n=1 Tax=Coilia grayii TaxID=363190 RepID=A0ABD1IRY3_9TELE